MLKQHNKSFKTAGQKRSIDKLRDGAGSFEIKTPDDDSAITGMITTGENLLAVKEKGVYAIKLADQIDPERKNINIPNTIQKILPYGSSEPWVGATLLTGNDLLKKEILNKDIDTEYAMSLVIEISKNIASAIELSVTLNESLSNELEKHNLEIKKDHSVMLPSMRGIANECKEYLQKTDHALISLFNVVKVFYPNVGKGGWESLKKEIDKENPVIDNFGEVLNQMMPFLQLVRNARNCVEHPRNGHKIIAIDFTIDANSNLLPPSIEVVHAKTPQPPIPIIDFMSQITISMVDVVELMLVFLCNRNIRPIQGFPVHVHEFPKAQRRTKNVKYGYGVATENSIIPFG